MAIITMALYHLQAGCDFYGRSTTAVWFHIPQAHRKRIMPLLLGNTFGQFANQATRCVYNTFDAQYSYPGSLWTSVFFGQNFLCALAGVFYQAVQERQLRRSQPILFPPPDDSGGLFQRLLVQLHLLTPPPATGPDPHQDVPENDYAEAA